MSISLVAHEKRPSRGSVFLLSFIFTVLNFILKFIFEQKQHFKCKQKKKSSKVFSGSYIFFLYLCIFTGKQKI